MSVPQRSTIENAAASTEPLQHHVQAMTAACWFQPEVFEGQRVWVPAQGLGAVRVGTIQEPEIDPVIMMRPGDIRPRTKPDEIAVIGVVVADELGEHMVLFDFIDQDKTNRAIDLTSSAPTWG